MLIIDSTLTLARALDSPIDLDLNRLLALRRDQLLSDTGGEYDLAELALFVIVAAGNTIAEIETAAGYPVVTNPAFEWVHLHEGRWFEAVTILSDDGFGTVLFVPDGDGVDPILLALLRAEVTSNGSTDAEADLYQILRRLTHAGDSQSGCDLIQHRELEEACDGGTNRIAFGL